MATRISGIPDARGCRRFGERLENADAAQTSEE